MNSKNDFYIRLYLNVPYSEKDEIKSLGAKFDGHIKKWYYQGSAQQLPKFRKWILHNCEETIITDNIYILTNKHVCWKCNHITTVIALGIGDYISLWRDCNNETYFDINANKDGHSIHLAWTDNERSIPPLLLKYLKDKYPVKTGYSNKIGSCFANHCEHCGAIQGNFHLFQENGPFFLWAKTERELKIKTECLNVLWIPCECSLQLDWDIYETPYDHHYEGFWSNEINLLENNVDPDYKELYELI